MKNRSILLLGLLLLVVAPLAGRLLIGIPQGFVEFPPRTLYISHAPFSWPVFILFAVLGLLAVVAILWPRLYGFKKLANLPAAEKTTSRIPWWGWMGLALNLAAWTCAWGRFEWLGPLKDHTFFPVWFGFILFLDGLVHKRKGHSRISTRPGQFFLLFPISAIVWWYFEYLNRFIQNWWYIGVDHFDAKSYFLFATLCFSTVLPAILETADLLFSFPHFRTGYAHGIKWNPPRGSAVGAVVLGAAGLVLLAVFPIQCFFMAWLAPLAIMGGCLAMAKQRTCFDGLTQGDYTMLAVFAVAALVCGFFWEMWNYGSMPKWNYMVPYVNSFNVFEMPIVGYGGYLPFGPTCLCLWLTARALLSGGESSDSGVPFYSSSAPIRDT